MASGVERRRGAPRPGCRFPEQVERSCSTTSPNPRGRDGRRPAVLPVARADPLAPLGAPSKLGKHGEHDQLASLTGSGSRRGLQQRRRRVRSTWAGAPSARPRVPTALAPRRPRLERRSIATWCAKERDDEQPHRSRQDAKQVRPFVVERDPPGGCAPDAAPRANRTFLSPANGRATTGIVASRTWTRGGDGRRSEDAARTSPVDPSTHLDRARTSIRRRIDHRSMDKPAAVRDFGQIVHSRESRALHAPLAARRRRASSAPRGRRGGTRANTSDSCPFSRRVRAPHHALAGREFVITVREFHDGSLLRPDSMPCAHVPNRVGMIAREREIPHLLPRNRDISPLSLQTGQRQPTPSPAAVAGRQLSPSAKIHMTAVAATRDLRYCPAASRFSSRFRAEEPVSRPEEVRFHPGFSGPSALSLRRCCS